MPPITALREKQGYQPELGTWRSSPLTPPILSLFLAKGLIAATENFGFHPRGGGRKLKQVYCTTERRVGLTDLFLSAFPVAASQGRLSKARH